ncbi:alpha/beta hydrolase family protein [Stenotrophomonas mori]|uniref:Alpha/beta fold hydrolase n=1 Tax=Stenotrophomonas mori TaxID=2871096 RepID=A0ABT0SK40_9GAMM|nr:prolyl oligopeptidase family serine peptidase [Stenotrophomonas mori]MCL7715627.1 alpha/beta fold hydrolase [Stenotrophomonas mori]
MTMRASRRIRRAPALLALCAGLLLAPPALLAAPPDTAGQQAQGYRLPSAALQAVVDAPRAPTLLLSPRRDLAAVLQTPPLPSIAQVAQPELKLAGLRINPKTFSDSRFSFGSALWLIDTAEGAKRPIDGLPQPLSVASMAWSPDQRYLAFNQLDPASGHNELWLVDVAAGSARRIAERLNSVLGKGYAWLPDSAGLLVMQRPAGQPDAPVDDGIPAGPAVQQTEAGQGVRAVRTYQDLLKNEHDARLFEYYLQAQPARVAINGQARPLGPAGIYLGLSFSPDGAYLLSQRVERPFSYAVPVSRFPRRIEVLDADGALVHALARLPLVEGLPTGNDAVPTGVRSIGWRADAPASLVWAEAQDGGDPSRDAPIRDAVMVQAAPFDRPPLTLARLQSRYSGITWGRGDVALLREYWWKTRQVKEWRIAPDHPEQAAQLVSERSADDRYGDPGQPLLQLDDKGRARLQFTADGRSYYRVGDGASAEGDRPFLDRVALEDGRSQRLFHSQAPYYEVPVAVTDGPAPRLLFSRESNDTPSDLYVRALDGDAPARALTDTPHPLPQLRGVRKEQIRYTREDGVALTADLLLPSGYDPKKDGPRPTLLWAYPAEFKSADDASQVTGSPYRFNAVGYWGPEAFLARGYVVLSRPTMPIVGEGDTEPNDTYIPQLVASARAAVDEVVRRGVADRDRIAVGGHSYGAFMTANLLAHTRLFKAGIARSGAYNRTLTPFGFQAEERNYWQAQATYLAMSPFNHAGDIKDPILFIHGADDNNSGTFPIQSERMFAAVKGLGGTARLVMLPNESHAYRARESIMTMLAESEDWLDRWLGAPTERKRR